MNKLNEWISVNDRLPESPAWVLVYADEAMNCMAYFNGQWKDWVGATAHNIDISKITHWIPLPEPPIGRTHESSTPISRAVARMREHNEYLLPR